MCHDNLRDLLSPSTTRVLGMNSGIRLGGRCIYISTALTLRFLIIQGNRRICLKTDCYWSRVAEDQAARAKLWEFSTSDSDTALEPVSAANAKHRGPISYTPLIVAGLLLWAQPLTAAPWCHPNWCHHNVSLMYFCVESRQVLSSLSASRQVSASPVLGCKKGQPALF